MINLKKNKRTQKTKEMLLKNQIPIEKRGQKTKDMNVKITHKCKIL